MATVGSILGGTFRFVRANPRAIAIWSALIFFFSLASMATMQPFYAARLAAMQGGTLVLPDFRPFILLILVMMLYLVVAWAAVFRAVIFPADARFGYLRLGMDELRLLGTVLIVYVGGYLACLIVGMVGGIILALGVAAVLGKFAATVVVIVAGLAMVCGLIWAAVRISPTAPLTIFRRKIVIADAWRLTRGAFWPLFGAYFVIVLLLIVVYTLVSVAQMGPVLGDMLRATDPEAQRRVAEWQVAHYSGGIFSLSTIGSAVLSAIVGGVTLALHAGATAVATTQLIDLREPDAGPGAVSE